MTYQHRSLSEFDEHPHKPGNRWAISAELGIDEFNLNLAELGEGEPLSQTHYHSHENQDEFYYVLDGRCRLEVEDESIDIAADEVVFIPRTVPHLVHNPYEEICKLIAIGSPPEGRYPVVMHDNYENILEKRYDGDPADAEVSE